VRPAARIVLLTLALVLAVAASAPAHDELPAALHGDTPQEVSLDVAAAVENDEQQAATGTALPTTWCGEAAPPPDDTANAVHDQTLPQFKLVYAFPRDRANRFAQWSHALQANVSLIGQFVAQQSGERKAPRFDMGTSCGPR
jgi:hypothetical protein